MGAMDDQLRALVDAVREGDNVAVRELVRCTQPVIWRLCNVMGSPGEEDDLVQDTYLRAFRSLDSYRGDAPITSWLLSIARRVCADHVRHRVRQRRLADVLAREVDDCWVAAPGNPTMSLLDAIDPDRREAFVLTQVAGLSYDEAAVVLDCPIGTIRSRVARARTDLVAEVRAAEAS
ncbi:MAG: sigma-70 family RNA polymerase sigma factor [Ilumatobacteraceae bacterium]